MGRHRIRFVLLGVAALLLLLGACGGGSDDEATPATTAASDAAAQEGGNDTPATTTTAPADDTAGTGDGEDPPAEATGGDLSLVPSGETDLLGNPAGQGFVELDGVRYAFILNSACQKIFGAVQSAGGAADGSNVNVDAVIPPEDWETDTAAGWDPPYVEIEIGDDSWRAAAGSQHLAGGETIELTPEQSSVGSFTNDGSRVAGEATFFSEYNYDEVESVAGAFEFYCP